MKRKNENPKVVIRIKPHHFIDIITSFGGNEIVCGPHPYGHALHTVSAFILANRDVILEMEFGADDICSPCKHNVNGFCDDIIDTSFRPKTPPSKREWNLLIDQRWCDYLGLKQGERLTARKFVKRLNKWSGDITGIYREIPKELIMERAAYLTRGIEKFGVGAPPAEKGA